MLAAATKKRRDRYPASQSPPSFPRRYLFIGPCASRTATTGSERVGMPVRPDIRATRRPCAEALLSITLKQAQSLALQGGDTRRKLYALVRRTGVPSLANAVFDRIDASHRLATWSQIRCAHRTSPRRNTSGDANRGTVRAEYPAVERRAVFVASKRRPRAGRKAPLTGLHALQRTSLVIIGRRPSTDHAKASLSPEETCNLELPFGESSPFTGGGCQRRSSSSKASSIVTIARSFSSAASIV
jgi:hypothetical protein